MGVPSLRASYRLALPAIFATSIFGQATTPVINELYVFQADGLTFPQGAAPGPVIQASDGNFYGTTELGGACPVGTCSGTVFKLTPAGEITTLYTFVYGSPTAPFVNGATPVGLVEGPDGYLYGTTFAGGNGGTTSVSSGYGTVFRISKSGDFQSLHAFCFGGPCEEGYRPSSLVLGRDGKFYGTTRASGSNHAASKGIVFRVSTTGVVETLHNFDGYTEGGAPLAGLVRGSDGNFYGTTSGGGNSQYASGTVFRITPAGVLSVLYTFQLGPPNPTKDGQAPEKALIQACHGDLYGVTKLGGLYQHGTVFAIGLDGQRYRTVFHLDTPEGNFANGLLMATDGNLWGSSLIGSLYTISTSGSLVQAFPFFQPMCGLNGPASSLIQGTDAKLYGTSQLCGVVNGASGGSGSVFSIDAGLPKPPLPTVGAVTNGASFAAGGIVPGEIATLFGGQLTSATGINQAGSLPLPTFAYDVEVFVNEIPAPLFAVDNVNGQQQINFQVPWEVAGQANATIRIENQCHTSASVTVPVLAAQPAIFSYIAGGVTYGAILHADYQLADSGHPAAAGETVLVYSTGLGVVSPTPQDGVAAVGEATVGKSTVTVGGVAATVSFSGLAPGFVGLNQVNVEVPTVASGNQPVVLSIDGVASGSVMLPVR